MVEQGTPTPTVTPISKRSYTGEHREHAERAGEDQARARDHRPGLAEGAQHALARAVHRGLLADAAHQEDVVVGAERDEEDEDDDRQHRVEGVLIEGVPEEHEAEPAGREEREDHGRDQEERHHERAEQDDQRHEDEREHERRDDLQVAARGVLQVDACRSPVARECAETWR